MNTRDIKTATIARLSMIQALILDGNTSEADLLLSDAIDSLLSSRVAITCETSDPSDSYLPQYDADTDGDYSDWLVLNNMD